MPTYEKDSSESKQDPLRSNNPNRLFQQRKDPGKERGHSDHPEYKSDKDHSSKRHHEHWREEIKYK